MSALAGTVNIPKVGPVKKVYAYGTGAVVAGYVLWRYYAAGSSAAAAPAVAAEDSSLDTSSVTDTAAGSGSVSGNVQYAGTVDTDATDGLVLTNDQWSNKAAGLLIYAGWDSQLILSTLGKYLDRQPLTDSEATLVRSAIAVTGTPPVGSYVIVHPTGDTGTVVPVVPVTPAEPVTPVVPIPTPADPIPAPSPAPVVVIPPQAVVNIPLVDKAVEIIKAKPTQSSGSVSTVPATTTTNPIVANVKANESMAVFQGRCFATPGIGFAPTLKTLQKLNPTKPDTIEKMTNNQPHGANQLRIK